MRIRSLTDFIHTHSSVRYTAANMLTWHSIIYLIRPQSDLIWAVVSERDTDMLKGKGGPSILIRPLTEFNAVPDTEVILQLTRAAGTTLMVESPQFFTAFRHVLETLQVGHF